MSILLSKSKLLQPAANEPFELEKCFKKYVSFERITDYGTLVQISDTEETLQTVILKTEENVAGKDELSKWLASQKFVTTAQKEEIFLHIERFLPAIYFWFKPNYFVQLGLRHILKLVTGNEVCEQQMATIMHTYEKDIYRLMLNAQALCRYIYTGEFIDKPDKFGRNFVRQCVLGLIETKTYQGKGTELFFPDEFLVDSGDESFWLTGSQLGKCNKSWFDRTKPPRELCMVTSQYKCIICKEFFVTAPELKQHVAEHTEKCCLECNVTFQSYKQLVIHTNTFCRRIVHGDRCIGCAQMKQNCQCGARFKIILQNVSKWTEENSHFQLKELFISLALQVAFQRNEIKINIDSQGWKKPGFF